MDNKTRQAIGFVSFSIITFTRNIIAALLVSAGLSRAAQIVPPDFRGARQPQVALSPSGVVLVTFGRSNTVYFTRSTNQAQTFSPPMEVFTGAHLSLGMRRGPRIVSTQNKIAITAVIDGDLLSRISTDDGKTWSTGIRLNAISQSAREGLHAMTAQGEKVFTAWLDLRNNQTELWGAVSTNGGQTWQPNRRIYQSPDGHICECCQPNAIFTPAGKLVVMWRNWLNKSRDLYWASSGDDGKTFSAPVKLGTGTWPLQGCPMDGGALTLDKTGEPLGVWRRKETIFLARDSSSEKILAAHGAQPVASLGPKELYLIWQQGSDLMMASGTPTDLSKPSLLAPHAKYASIASSAQFNPIAVWETDSSIWAVPLPFH